MGLLSLSESCNKLRCVKTLNGKQTFAVVVLLLIAIGVIGHLQESSHQETSANATTDDTALAASHEANTAPVPHWNLSVSRDEMSGTEMRTLSIESNNELEFGFPYSGGSKGTIALRHWRGRDDLLFRVSKGQFSCSVDDCIVHVKFDDGKTQAFSADEPTDGSTGLLFIHPYGRFLAA